VQCLEALAAVACERALYETAARLIGSAAAQRQRLAVPLPDADRAMIATVEERLARSLGPDAAERIRQAGRAMPLGRAGELAAAVAAGTVPSDPDRGRPALLTRRERQVTALVASGRTNRQIGRALGIAEKTAEIHLQHVMAKLHASSRAEVAAWAVSHRLDDSAV
jgi:non-specific serine/threonine protein kinase